MSFQNFFELLRLDIFDEACFYKKKCCKWPFIIFSLDFVLQINNGLDNSNNFSLEMSQRALC
jgi:hypothetical protein